MHLKTNYQSLFQEKNNYTCDYILLFTLIQYSFVFSVRYLKHVAGKKYIHKQSYWQILYMMRLQFYLSLTIDKFRAYDAFVNLPTSGTFKEICDSQRDIWL